MMSLRERMKEAGIPVPLEEDLLALGGLIADWFDEPGEETRRLKYRHAIESLREIAMNLPADDREVPA
jgi:hypothetical protein